MAAPETTWPQFYEARVGNKSYLKYFEKRYFPLIDTVLNIRPDRLCEEGIGIGNVSKIILKTLPHTDCFGFDSSKEMLHLCNKNVPAVVTWEDL